MPGIELRYSAGQQMLVALSCCSLKFFLFTSSPYLTLFDSPDSSVLDKKHNDVAKGDPSSGRHPLHHPHPITGCPQMGENPGRQHAKASLHQAGPTRTLAPRPHQCYFTSRWPPTTQLRATCQKTPLPFPSPQCQTC